MMHSSKKTDSGPAKISYRLFFILLFLVFGTIIAILTSAINYNFDLQNTKDKLNKAAKEELQNKRRELGEFTRSLEGYVAALRNSEILHEFIRTPTVDGYDDLISLFYSVAATNPAFMQVRYLDEIGKERVRVDWNSGEMAPKIIETKRLQDKSHRYYFAEASQTKPNDFWYSKLDLNVENKKIEVPYKPVLRVASPVYVDQKYRGIVIINSHAKRFLNSFRRSTLFSVCLIDRDGEFIAHHDDSYSWSRYLQSGYTILQDQPEYGEELMQHIANTSLTRVGDLYIASLQSFLVQDGAALLMHPETAALQALHQEQRRATLFIVAVITLLSIPVALLLSKIPARLNQKISSQNSVLTEYVDLIDENIITSVCDVEGKVIEVSSAFSRICGYSKEELIGKQFSMLRHDDIPAEAYLEVWEYLVRGQMWKGDLKYQRKDRSTYWTHTTIHPKLNRKGEMTSYTAIHQDITDKKTLEEISITDALTGLYNRRFFNTIIGRELKRAQRNGKMLTFAMMDVDHFKPYNDHYGHQQGDVVLTTIGETLNTLLGRGGDFCFRLGGEEFGILFTSLSQEDGISFAEKIRLTIEELAIEHQWSEVAPVLTLSMGLLFIAPGSEVTVDEMYKQADEALYTAKGKGRNRVVARLFETKP